MKYIYGILLFIWTTIEVIEKSKTNFMGTGFILIALCLFVVKEKFLDQAIYGSIYAVVIITLAINNHYLLILLGIALVDMAYFKKYVPLGIFAFIAIMLCYIMDGQQYVFPIIIGALWGYTLRKNDDKEKKHLSLLDNERGLRYQLEKTQIELGRLQNEIERTAEVRERDRIAKEIHDSIGHSIAGVLFQLRAAERLVTTNTQKVEQILKLTIEKLVEALEITRNTVYNMKSDQTQGIDRIQSIIKEFKFCKINFSHSGDFNTISTSNFKMLESTTKELLTNAIKHSLASEITMKIDINSKHIRYFYKDNGRGCDKIKENIGLSSIRDRVKNFGGTYSIDGSDGFTVVFTLPNIKEIEA
ncbi:MAG: sensor histidine kinase [Ruminiclostridium sp.]